MQKIDTMLKMKSNLELELEKDYDEALKDENFKIIVSKLKRKREELIKYTSSLEKCAKEYACCSFSF